MLIVIDLSSDADDKFDEAVDQIIADIESGVTAKSYDEGVKAGIALFQHEMRQIANE